jgi:hypothetical protein
MLLRDGKCGLTGLSPEVGQEVDDQVEEDRVDDLVRQIGKHRCESLGRRVVAVSSARLKCHEG